MLEMHIYIKCNLSLIFLKFIFLGKSKMDYIFVKFFCLSLGLGLDYFWSRSQTLGPKMYRSRSRSHSQLLWSRLQLFSHSSHLRFKSIAEQERQIQIYPQSVLFGSVAYRGFLKGGAIQPQSNTLSGKISLNSNSRKKVFTVNLSQLRKFFIPKT